MTIEARFASDVKAHEMNIALDQDLHRQIRFQRPGSSSYWFDLVTWPGSLCISGDMGSYVFARSPDMFGFFRGETINPGYWGEKLKSISAKGGFREFSRELAEKNVREYDDEIDQDVVDELFNELDRVESRDERGFYETVMEFEHEGYRPFSEFYEVNCDEYTHQYLWCLHAIVWGIQQYDKAKASEVDKCKA